MNPLDNMTARIKKKLGLQTAAELMHYAVSYQRSPQGRS